MSDTRKSDAADVAVSWVGGESECRANWAKAANLPPMPSELLLVAKDKLVGGAIATWGQTLCEFVVNLRQDLSAAVRERDEALERNKRLTDGCQRLSAALSRIDYLCGEPNEYETSFYDMHMDECAVVTNVETLRKERDEARAEVERLRAER